MWSIKKMINYMSNGKVKTGFNGDIYDFSVDYDAISVSDILVFTSIWWKRIK